MGNTDLFERFAQLILQYPDPDKHFDDCFNSFLRNKSESEMQFIEDNFAIFVKVGKAITDAPESVKQRVLQETGKAPA